MLARFTFAMCAVLLTLQGASAAIVTSAVNPANGHNYYLLERANWTDAEAEAISLNGHLATINDAAENAWVLQTFAPFTLNIIVPSLWIGFTDAAQEGNWVWISGEPVTFTNWGTPNNAPPEPNSIYPTEDYAAMTTVGFNGIQPGQWWDTTDTREPPGVVVEPGAFGVVEVVPLPASLPAGLAVLTGFAAVRLVCRRCARR